MIRLSLDSSTEKIRKRFRKFLKQNPPPSLAIDHSLEDFIAVSRNWQQTLADAGFLGLSWPKEFQGSALTLVEEAVIQEELIAFNSPQLLGLFGLTMVAPVLIKHGTQAQKDKFLKRILTAEDIWCQGFSEPEAGSDLLNLKSRAEKVDGGYLLTGQKVWTSFAQIASWCFVLCRTSKEEKRHQGLSYLLVDMKSPGIEVRPLKQITGDAEFNEVFFDKVFVAEENLVGTEGQGWNIAIATLMYERVVLTFARLLQSEQLLNHLLKKVKKLKDPIAEQKLADLLSEACAVRALAYKHLLQYKDGRQPGPEGSLDKLFWSESFQKIASFALDLEAKDWPSLFTEEAKASLHTYLYSRGRTIAAGTSEIQRNIIAERVLGIH